MKCAYCGKEAKATKEHIISSGILDLFPECYLTYDETRQVIHEADPTVKDVCADCNNNKISYIDSYAKEFIGRYFTRKYKEGEIVEIEYDYAMIQKVLLKYAYNALRSHKEDCSFFDNDMLHFLMNESDNIPKDNVTILCGLAINVSPVPDAIFGNLKLRWCKDPLLNSNSTIRYIDYETGQIFLNENIEREDFPDLQFSYLFRFNSVQFLLMCWTRDAEKIEQNKVILEYQYPYYLMKANDKEAVLPICTNEINYHAYENIHVRWDGLFEVGLIRRLASGGKFEYKESLEKEWLEEEKRLKEKYPR